MLSGSEAVEGEDETAAVNGKGKTQPRMAENGGK